MDIPPLINHLTSTVVAIIIINRPSASRSSLEFDLFYAEDDDSRCIRFLCVCNPQADGVWGSSTYVLESMDEGRRSSVEGGRNCAAA